MVVTADGAAGLSVCCAAACPSQTAPFVCGKPRVCVGCLLQIPSLSRLATQCTSPSSNAKGKFTEIFIVEKIYGPPKGPIWFSGTYFWRP